MQSAKYILGNGTHHDGIKKVFGNTAPLLYPSPAKYSSSNVTKLMEKIKKGSQKFRKVLTRHQVITKARVDSWRKTLQCNSLDSDTLRQAFKMIHWKEFTAPLTRKLLFNNQHKHLYRPGQERSDWAMEDSCWDCRIVDEEER